MFIKLKRVQESDLEGYFATYINMDKVTDFYKAPKFGVPLTKIFIARDFILVKETPEEIIKLIEEASK